MISSEYGRPNIRFHSKGRKKALVLAGARDATYSWHVQIVSESDA